MRRLKWLVAVTLLSVLTPSAFGADDDAEAREAKKRATSAISRFKSKYKSRKPDHRCNALLDLSRVEHAAVVAEMAKVLKKDRSEDVRSACVMLLGDMPTVPTEAGAALKAHAAACVKGRKEDAEILKDVAKSIGKLRYKGAHAELLWMLDHKDQWVVVEAIRAIMNTGDKLALPKLYDMAKYQGATYSWSTGSVSVDTGASGTADQEAAEAAWKAKYGGVRPRKAGPQVVKLYMRHLRECVEKLTGKKFQKLADFKAWLKEHAKEVGMKPEKPKR
jgi:hypothetical protein